MLHIYLSLMAVKSSDIKKEINLLQPLCAGFHIDVMDNIFVPNLMWNNPQEVNNLVRQIKSPWIHLMVEKPDLFYAQLTLPEGTIVSFHIETEIDVFRFIKTIKEKKQRASIAIRPKTPIKEVVPFVHVVDQILLMSVEPGFSGQPFLESTFGKLAQLVAYRQQHDAHFKIGLDGGINEENIIQLVQEGMDDCAIAGAIFQHNDHSAALQKLQKLVKI